MFPWSSYEATLLKLLCRGCGAPISDTFVDLGNAPLSNGYLNADDLEAMEPTFPLHARVCRQCFLVQVPQFEAPERIFCADYAYYSSYSESWLEHSRRYVELATARLALSSSSHVVEVASNDGYLLQYFVERGIPAHGIEPAQKVAQVARDRGIPTESFFLGKAQADAVVQKFARADLVAANNVMAHVPDLHDFVAGLATLLAPGGTLTVEFPHVLELIEHVQFDTIYHEHFSYLSLLALEPVLAKHGLRVYDATKLSSHGGSLRLWIAHADSPAKEEPGVAALRADEAKHRLGELATYEAFAPRVHRVKRDLLQFLIGAATDGKSVAAYGAAAKGNTLLNYCGVREEMVRFVVDRNPNKAGRWMPGSRIPIYGPSAVFERRPDYLLVLPWNIVDEVTSQMSAIREYGGKFVIAIPQLTVLP
jgi:SAM-dependent methyltransferase